MGEARGHPPYGTANAVFQVRKAVTRAISQYDATLPIAYGGASAVHRGNATRNCRQRAVILSTTQMNSNCPNSTPFDCRRLEG